MELFTAAGIDLPPSGGGRGRRGVLRSLRVPLFNYKIVQRARELAAFAPSADQKKAAQDYARKVKNPKFLKQKETAVRPLFIQDILQTVLGYRPYDPAEAYTLAHEESIRTGAVDVAIGRFNHPDTRDAIVAPFELKGPDTDDLDKIMPGRGRSPVQQAWDYAIDAPGSRWVLVSNCIEIRLYGFGRGRDAYEVFDLTRLDEEEEHARLWLVLGADRFLGGETDRLLRETDSAYKDITDDLYKQYKKLREDLIDFLTNSADGPKLAALQAIEPAQKVLDRILFIAFAQRTDLLPDRLLEDASKDQNRFVPQPIWMNFLALFRAVDRGNDRLAVWAYNGGLFAEDPLADSLILPDPLAQDVAKLGQWDYRREVPVTVLGHIFEQSITDIEKLKAESKGEAPPEVSKRKREGVVYTPDMVTRFLVERTIGQTLDERRAALWAEHGMREGEPVEPAREIAFWLATLAALRDFTIVDPACGSGAFLVAAFDEMARRYRDCVSRLVELGIEIGFDIFDEIVTKNLHGVDVNAESVEITRLALWLKTARRDHRLQNLEATIKCGNSLIDDPKFTDRPFDWRLAFPDIFARGGFDVVIGNPPYVRMELLKPVKPYLEEHYVVAADRADLYAYFFEKGLALLKQGGRLGFISSSTFFRTGSGANLRIFLGDHAVVESVVDFGDLQLFEGVTTYPAILTVRKADEEEAGDLSFLTVKDHLPEDLGRAFAQGAQTMPRARLGAGSWRFEDDTLARLRDKIAMGRKTLGEVYGAPAAGIKTGLNAAFVINGETRHLLINDDSYAAPLIKKFAMGDAAQRWAAEFKDQYVLYLARKRNDILKLPSIERHLLPFKNQLEQRALNQEWFELQQAQPGYEYIFNGPKIIFRDISEGGTFSIDLDGLYIDMTCFAIPTADFGLLSLLNSKLAWFFWNSMTPELRGGYVRLKRQFVEQLPIPSALDIDLATLGQTCTDAARARFALQSAVRHRILDLAPPERKKLNGRLENWHDLSFAAFRDEVKKAFHADVPIKERGDWEHYLAETAAEVNRLSQEIATAEREIDQTVYRLFDLTSDEIVLLEASLAGQY
ncbi:N-6 DNA methylase [Methylovirgula sp. HY1]|uniref:Eco57I restriction-modification methylase domain-containing protein n=1 Tax=Methylovirgula sp. HY1 TaxID=2822761 RepID=UPI001C5B79BD|nr:N-6 DNA methylase [Methylovirgula sp. HY1]QXX75213.1 Type IIS restriction enzyme Eco57I [Methylovirgula sp. HY1]